MSWFWGNETAEQAHFVVSALQSELDERESKIKALEAALKREQHDMTSLLEDEVKELEARRKAVEKELASVDALITEKQKLILLSKKKKKTTNKVKTTRPLRSSSGIVSAENKHEVTDTRESKESSDEVVQSPTSQKKPQTKQISHASAYTRTALPMDQHLKIVAKEEPNVAFIIQRSTNSNTVVYAGCKSSDGKSLDATTPIQVYWIMYEKDGNPREDLNMIERNTAYGVTTRPSDAPGEYMAMIASLRDRDCILRLDKHGNILALTTINGQSGILLRRVFVQMTTSWGIPTVDYVEIFGVNLITLAPVYERKTIKK
ncbi:hypothetical protein CCR75_002186 [Bremia lactucae]|uniref:DUF4833 domain-containing protein n=1 Tax=Bremia lactucae TaxID=4779 RepID=A0A976FS19_BRELC|nr:hypothetical protein CCR75_002186 [Bremia lactucae]